MMTLRLTDSLLLPKQETLLCLTRNPGDPKPKQVWLHHHIYEGNPGLNRNFLVAANNQLVRGFFQWVIPEGPEARFSPQSVFSFDVNDALLADSRVSISLGPVLRLPVKDWILSANTKSKSFPSLRAGRNCGWKAFASRGRRRARLTTSPEREEPMVRPPIPIPFPDARTRTPLPILLQDLQRRIFHRPRLRLLRNARQAPRHVTMR